MQYNKSLSGIQKAADGKKYNFITVSGNTIGSIYVPIASSYIVSAFNGISGTTEEFNNTITYNISGIVSPDSQSGYLDVDLLNVDETGFKVNNIVYTITSYLKGYDDQVGELKSSVLAVKRLADNF